MSQRKLLPIMKKETFIFKKKKASKNSNDLGKKKMPTN